MGFAAIVCAAALTQVTPSTTAQADNPEMAALLAADQAARKTAPKIDWSVVGPADAQRREAVRGLLAGGRLHTAKDFNAAAFVFQHGHDPGDYLLAHTLAEVAVAKGDRKSLWIASASLDRYLVAIGQKQIYGTQFTLPRQAGAVWSQEPYDRTLISDALRQELGVRTQPEQLKQMADMEAERRGEPAK